jgi:hypothetical protein
MCRERETGLDPALEINETFSTIKENGMRSSLHTYISLADQVLGDLRSSAEAPEVPTYF